MTAEKYLSQYLELNAEIDAKLEEKAQVRALAQRATPSEQRGGSGAVSDRVGRGAARLVDLEREIDQKIDQLVDLREEILAAINRVPDAKQRQILRYRYINGWSWEEIAEKMGYSERWVRELHKKALKNF